MTETAESQNHCDDDSVSFKYFNEVFDFINLFNLNYHLGSIIDCVVNASMLHGKDAQFVLRKAHLHLWSEIDRIQLEEQEKPQFYPCSRKENDNG